MRRAAAVAALGLVAVLGPAPAAGAALPGPLDGLDVCQAQAPPAEVPGRGIAGFVPTRPDGVAPANPFEGSGTTVADQYGVAGRWNTYDLGCAGSVRNPDAPVGTAIANWVFTVTKTVIAVSTAIFGAAMQADFLDVFDPLIATAVQAMVSGVLDRWLPVALAALGAVLLWRSRHARVSSTATAVAWAVLLLVAVTAVVRWPLHAGRAADTAVSTTVGAVAAGLSGRAPGESVDPAADTRSVLVQALLYEPWAAGTFGSASSPSARKWGPCLWQAQTLRWDEADAVADGGDTAKDLLAAKAERYEKCAAEVKDADPDGYEYLTGKRSDARVGYAALSALLALLLLPFLLVAAAGMIGAYLIVRVAVMVAPGLVVPAVIPSLRPLLLGVASVVASAVVNCVVFAAGALLAARGLGVVLAADLPRWLQFAVGVILMLVMWSVLGPFRRLTRFVSSSRSTTAGLFSAPMDGVRDAAGGAWRWGKTAAAAYAGGVGAGVGAAGRVAYGRRDGDDEELYREPARAEEQVPDDPAPAAPVPLPAPAPVPELDPAPARERRELGPAPAPADHPPSGPAWPEGNAGDRFLGLRDSGFTGPIDQDGYPVLDVDQWVADHLPPAPKRPRPEPVVLPDGTVVFPSKTWEQDTPDLPPAAPTLPAAREPQGRDA